MNGNDWFVSVSLSRNEQSYEGKKNHSHFFLVTENDKINDSEALKNIYFLVAIKNIGFV
jgi:hypothetical protein